MSFSCRRNAQNHEVHRFDDGKRCVQPLDVACILFLVGRRSRVSGEGGTEEGVWSGPALHTAPADDGKRVRALDVAICGRKALTLFHLFLYIPTLVILNRARVNQISSGRGERTPGGFLKWVILVMVNVEIPR